MNKPILFHDIDGVLFGVFDGTFQLRPGVKVWLHWAHEHFEVVWLTSWPQAKIEQLLAVVYHEKFLKQSPTPQVKYANWSQYASKAAWLSNAITKFDGLPPGGLGRDFFWIDDDMSAQEIEAYELPAHRCIHVSAHGSDVCDGCLINIPARRVQWNFRKRQERFEPRHHFW